MLSGTAVWFVLCAGALPVRAGDPPGPRLADDGRSLELRPPGLPPLDCRWAATIGRDGKRWTLAPDGGGPDRAPEVRESSPTGLTWVLGFPEQGAELWFRVRLEEGSVWCARAGVRNSGDEAFQLFDTTPLQANLRLGDPGGWLLTGLHPRTPVLAAAPGPGAEVRIHEHGSLYRPDGLGFVFGPVGDPVTHAEFTWKPGAADLVTMTAVTPMDGVRVEPGETRWGQEVAILPGEPRAAIGRWAAMVARSHGALLGAGALSGWNNWNYLAKKDVRRELLEVVDVVRDSSGRLRPGVVQMDYNYSDSELKSALSSDWVPDYRDRVGQLGARFGTHIGVGGPGWPGLAGLPELTATVTRAVAAGLTYLKVFYPASRAASDGRRTAFEVYRDDWSAIRRAAGEAAYLLFCDYEPHRAAIGRVDASRVGPDADRGKVSRAIPSFLRSLPLHDRWFAIDGDSYFTGTDIANISRIEGSWPLVRTWLSMTGLSCGAAITSDPWYWDDLKPYWRNVEILTPPARERTEVMDLGTDKEWPRLLGHVRRDWGRFTVALLWNPAATERTVTLDFAKAGMDPAQRYAVWSFWDDRYLGVAQGSWTTPRLGPAASQHLVFTALDPAPERPVLIGSNLHIYCGAAEIRQLASDRDSLSIDLTDAGARDGDLYLYSRLQPILAAASGCTVSGITSAGENVWRLSLHDRRPGAPQRIELAIQLPANRQPWFWILIATVALSLLFAAWRYVVGLRLERALALDRERARIARDIHDDLGASLTHIALLGELAQNDIDRPERARVHVDDIFRAACKLTRSVDEIVWALNPSNDSIPRFAAYVGDFTQEFLQSADIGCRLSIPADLPGRPLPPKVRHELFLAIKEALHNIVSHAAASSARLEISMRGDHLRVLIADDGRGFDPASPAPGRPGGGHGLANLRQRMQEVGGSLEILSSPGGGTTVVLEVKP
ncbi:MAG: sensor histidine kinase [Verrucomicrobia bacterium]|nr:MAG: sensor histidine kinase [Verrucomicrobiota bacterium]